MRFFSKLVFILNLCFLITVGIIFYRNHFGAKLKEDQFLVSNPIESTISVLGLIAVVVNVFFIVTFLAMYPMKKMNGIGKFVLYFNLIVLPAQIYYYFLLK